MAKIERQHLFFYNEKSSERKFDIDKMSTEAPSNHHTAVMKKLFHQKMHSISDDDSNQRMHSINEEI